MSMKINEFEEGLEVNGFYLLKTAEIKLTNTSTPKEYLDIVLSDRTGEVAAKLWDISSMHKETLIPPMIVNVKGIVQSYKEKMQVRIIQINPANEEDGQSITDFIRTAPIHPDALIQKINHHIVRINDPDIRSIVNMCVGRATARLREAPAAKGMHHNYYAGLAYHIARMLEIGEFICGQRPFLNPDLIRAGIILHDITKTEELVSELGIVKDYSTSGKLIGHISIAANWIAEAAMHLGLGIDHQKVMVLQHLILSHHNLGEWGSPVRPQIPEAAAIHYIDQLDAKLQAIEDAMGRIPAGNQWSEPVRAAENMQFFRFVPEVNPWSTSSI